MTYLEIRFATPQDAPAIHHIVHTAFAEYRGVVVPLPEGVTETLEEVEADIEQGCVLVALDGETAVGTARYRVDEGCLYMRRMAVLPQRRGRGVGEALMLHIEGVAWSLECMILRLSTRKSLPRNLSFYGRLGYVLTKVEPHPRGPDWTVSFEKRLR